MFIRLGNLIINREAISLVEDDGGRVRVYLPGVPESPLVFEGTEAAIIRDQFSWPIPSPARAPVGVFEAPLPVG